MQLLQTALAAIYPPRCLACGGMVDSDFGLCGTCWGQTPFVGHTRCDMCSVPLPGQARGEVLHCDDCMRAPKPWAQGRAALIYDGIARKMVLGFKHGDRQEIATPAAQWMLNTCRDMLDETVLIAPVPLHWMRLAKRRYNQSALLARALADLAGCDWCPDLLVRTQYTPSLDGKSRDVRQGILNDSIVVNKRRRHRIAGRPVLLVDDVLTTGATLGVCTEMCRAAGASRVCISVLARAVKAPYIPLN
ncbi:double zinc ribbon domain-containing protein [uncultured Tateyamaria sp.]|uniref:double zinc ribbon domain-containing protein n=1 Tax=Tateyamaria sp. 1078 TaxID=3417464 RepID=UPI0026202B90|nr:double zinc ribbon domain-containing protein [uncultured Tateyamaria sp.]